MPVFEKVNTVTGVVKEQYRVDTTEATLAYAERPYVIELTENGKRFMKTIMQEITSAFSEPPPRFESVAVIEGIPQDQSIQVAGSGRTDQGLLFFVFSTQEATWVAPVYGSDDPNDDYDPFDQGFFQGNVDSPRDLIRLDAYPVGDNGQAQDVYYGNENLFHCTFVNSFFVLGQTTVTGNNDPVSIEEPVFDIREIVSGFSGSVGVVFLSDNVFCFFFVESYRMMVYTVEIDSDGAWDEKLHAVVFDDFEEVTDVQTGRLGSTPFVRLVDTEHVYFAPFEDDGKLRGIIRFAWPEEAGLVATHDKTRPKMAMFDRFNAYITSVVGGPTVFESPNAHQDVLFSGSDDTFGLIVEQS